MNSMSQEPAYGSGSDRSPQSNFLFPLRLPVVRSHADPLLARLFQAVTGPRRIPFDTVETGAVVGSFGGPVPIPGGSTIDDIVTTLPANLLVIFVLQQMENEIVAGGGVTEQCWATWETHGPEATVENGGPFALPVPMPGQVWPISHANGIYQGLINDGCGATPTFPVEFHSTVGEQDNVFDKFVQIGEFHAVDNSTIQPNGFWTFAYTIRAEGTNGGVSDFKFSGIVSVTCSIDESLIG